MAGGLGALLGWTIPLGGGRSLALSGGAAAWIWAGAAVFAFALILALYRYERRLVSRRAGLTLLALRLSAALALSLALLEPISERSYQETLKSRIVLGVDLSESMETADADRDADQRSRLAALGKADAALPESARRREVVRALLEGPWLERLRAAVDVDVVGFARAAWFDTKPMGAVGCPRPCREPSMTRAHNPRTRLPRASAVP